MVKNAPQKPPRDSQNRPVWGQDPAKIGQVEAKIRPRPPKLGPRWPFCCHLGPSWARLCASWRQRCWIFSEIRRYIGRKLKKLAQKLLRTFIFPIFGASGWRFSLLFALRFLGFRLCSCTHLGSNFAQHRTGKAPILLPSWLILSATLRTDDDANIHMYIYIYIEMDLYTHIYTQMHVSACTRSSCSAGLFEAKVWHITHCRELVPWAHKEAQVSSVH